MSKSLSNQNTLNKEGLGSRMFSQRIADSNRIMYELGLPKRLEQSLVQKRYSTKSIWYFGKGAKDTKLIKVTLPKFTSQAKITKRLTLNCCFHVSEKGSDYFSKYSTGLVALKHLSLRFRVPELWQFRFREVDPSEMNNTGFRHLKEALRKIRSLESLDLCLKDHFYVTDESLEILSQGFKVHRFLKTIALSFNDCFQIKNFGIHEVCKGLRNLIFLQNISLNFAGCDLVTNEGLFEVLKVLKKLKCLQEIDLDIRSWKKINKNLVENVIQDLEALPSFQRITIKPWGRECVIRQAGNPMKFRWF